LGAESAAGVVPVSELFDAESVFVVDSPDAEAPVFFPA
jgi:hypothetical protein